MKSAFRSPHIHKGWFHNDRSSWFHQWIVIGDDFMMKVGGEITSEFTSEIIKISVAFAIWFSYCDIKYLMILYDRQYMNHLWRIDPVITDSLSESAQARSLGYWLKLFLFFSVFVLEHFDLKNWINFNWKKKTLLMSFYMLCCSKIYF